MTISGGDYVLPSARPDNTETADATELEALWQDIAEGINYSIDLTEAITVDFGDLGSLPTTLSGFGITDAQPLDATLTALAGVTFAADKGLYATGDDAFATFDLSSYMRGIMDSADEAALKTAINFTDGIPQIATVNTFTAAQRTTIVSLTDAASIAMDMDDGNDFEVTLGGNRTLANPSNLTAGQSGSIRVIQDGAGSRTLTFGTYWKFANATAPTLSTDPGAVDILHYKVWSSTFIEVTAHLDVS